MYQLKVKSNQAKRQLAYPSVFKNGLSSVDEDIRGYYVSIIEEKIKVHIVDAIMGAGKTSAAINYMKSNPERRFLYITPYLDEVDRIQSSISQFKSPDKKPTKQMSIKELIKKRYNIVSTHSLFQHFDKELIQLCRDNDYTLIMDEVAKVVDNYNISKADISILKKDYISVEESTGLMRWRKDKNNYTGRFMQEKIFCELDSLVEYHGDIMLWLFPVKAFTAFREIFILTYLFDAQLQKYYYDFYGLKYDFYYIKGNSIDNYQFSTEFTEQPKYNFKSLINIEDSEKLNRIGSIDKNDLSKSWYMRNSNSGNMKMLKNNIYNFFRNKCNASSQDLYWTTFKDYSQELKGNGYSSYKRKSRFLACNARATNDYKDCWAVAYAINIFVNPIILNFFTANEIKIDQDLYALSEMLQFIWRSRIRNGESIYVYIPSMRMRTLLENWIAENSIE